MARILLLAFIIFVIYLIVRGIARKRAQREAPPAAPMAAGEDMIVCARCGVNLPRSSARLLGDKLVCDNNPHCK